MARFRHFKPSLFKDDKGDVIFIEDENGVRMFSYDKDEDKRFADRYEEDKKDGMSFDDMTTGFSYYSSEDGDYSGENKKKIDALIAKMKYGKVRIKDS